MAGIVDLVVQDVLASPKYWGIDRRMVENVARAEGTHSSNRREAAKSTKGKLHAAGGAYLPRRPDYRAMFEALQRARHENERERFLTACRSAMSCHTSSRERLPVLERFYGELMGELGPVESVLDVACGLNPVALPWMTLSDEAEYFAIDMYSDMIEFVGQFLSLINVCGKALCGDVRISLPDRRFDVALVLKLVPCLEALERGAAIRLLEKIDAKHTIVSFSARSLCAQRVNSVAHYENLVVELAERHGWSLSRHVFGGEVCCVILR